MLLYISHFFSSTLPAVYFFIFCLALGYSRQPFFLVYTVPLLRMNEMACSAFPSLSLPSEKGTSAPLPFICQHNADPSLEYLTGTHQNISLQVIRERCIDRDDNGNILLSANPPGTGKVADPHHRVTISSLWKSYLADEVRRDESAWECRSVSLEMKISLLFWEGHLSSVSDWWIFQRLTAALGWF